ncbi:DUF1491 family protein [Zhengella sp. ZM62]|uniref:DUF1491 family protein n=1 Tax=Zhengella sedimenti TaxID=3390035 RepID=UPI0039754307
MRLTSDIWIAALVRRVFSEGGFAAIERRGATEAGAIFIKQRDRDGRQRLFAPAPQSGYGGDRPAERLFVEVDLDDDDPFAADDRLAREIRFDPDAWIVEIEPARQPEAPFFPVTKP